jgi:site-specific DNA recombinase
MRCSARRKPGYVTGGRVFGYRNHDVAIGVDAHGRPIRSHVERRINEDEAVVVREIFSLAAQGVGRAAIAKRLNLQGRQSPRAQQGRLNGWWQSSVREVLFRDTYRGVIVWNKTKKRDEFGRAKAKDRPASEWMRIEAPQLRIVSDAQWNAAHERLANTRAAYLRSSGGKL